jgi:hypothetical protein
MKRSAICFLLWLSYVLPLVAQSGSWGISLDYARGHTLRHRSSMVFDLPRPAQAISLEAICQTDGRRYAEAVLRRFRWGLGFTWLDYGGQRDELGYAYSLYPFFDLPLLRGPRLSLWARMAMGFSYLDRVYHRSQNPINNAVGSHLNNHTAFALLGELRLDDRWSVRLGGIFSHQSNAKRTLPNLGLNTPKLRGGLTYRFWQDSAVLPLDPVRVPFDHEWHWYGRVGLALTENKVPDGPLYPISVAAVYVSRRVNRANKFFGGLEYSYDQSIRAFMLDQGIPEDTPNWDPQKVAVLGGYEVGCGHFGMTAQALVYLHRLPERRLAGWGTKFGPHLYLRNQERRPSSNVFFAVYLLTELAVAKYFETSVGIMF